MFRRKALLVWLRLQLYERILNYITNNTFFIRTFNSQETNVKDCLNAFGYKWICAYRLNIYVFAFFVLQCSLVTNVIEMVFVQRFAYQKDND
jgi:hypothetical protein